MQCGLCPSERGCENSDISGCPMLIGFGNISAVIATSCRFLCGNVTTGKSQFVMESMSIALARKLEPDGITVNVIFPGRASTAMTRSLSAAGLPGPMKCCLPCMKCFFKDDGGTGAAKAAHSTTWGCTTSPDMRSTVSRPASAKTALMTRFLYCFPLF